LKVPEFGALKFGAVGGFPTAELEFPVKVPTVVPVTTVKMIVMPAPVVRNAAMAAEQFGYTTAGLFGYSHLAGGYWGGQAEYVRVPMADVAPMKVPQGMSDEEILFLSDIFPTGYQAAEQAGIKGSEIVAIWGAGPVGYFAIQSAKLLGAERIIVVETVPERVAARKEGGRERHHRLRERRSVRADQGDQQGRRRRCRH
jgi:threonine dehydrogenase-like Zn-dependent dehydrogenase